MTLKLEGGFIGDANGRNDLLVRDRPPIKLRFETIDRFRETKTFKSLKGAKAYADRRIGKPYDISLTFGYIVDSMGVGKLSIVSGTTFAELGYTE